MSKAAPAAQSEVDPRDARSPAEPRLKASDAPDDQPAQGGGASIVLTCVGSLLAVAAAAWMLGGVFVGPAPRFIAVGSTTLGVALVALSYRTSRPAVVQYLALPAGIVLGAVLVAPDTSGGSANLPSLVVEAIRGGGLSQPPAPFDPGWRFLLTVLCVVLSAGATSLALAAKSPRLAVAIPVPIVVGATILQPTESAVTASIVAMVLLIAALTVSFGADLSSTAGASRSFEMRHLAKGAGGLSLLVVLLIGLSQLGFLFDTEVESQVIPPQKPEAQPPLSDRVLFTVDAPEEQPWRLGVLDVYEDNAWKYPPYDRSRLEQIPADGSLPSSSERETETVKITFDVVDMQGHVLPTAPLAVKLSSTDFVVKVDPRTQTIELPDQRASKDMTYTVEALAPPGTEALSQAPPSSSDAMATFLDVPEAPEAVQNLLARAPSENLFDRLQFVRNQFYKNVIAAGQGEPVDVPPIRVAEMLDGAEATPYEITAAEGLLARWAGLPARLGYGFYGGDESDDVFEVHPEHGATWLEAYFEDIGWVAIVGKPPRAKASTSLEEKNPDPEILPSDELALVVHVPVRLQSLRLLYETVRFYALMTLPWLAGGVLVLVYYPAFVKLLRSVRRRHWASKRGIAARILVSYCECRDRLHDLNAPRAGATPLEFTDALDPDPEHWELGWLVTRTLWGDLRRDLRTEDAEAAEDMARSVARRVARAQRATTRLLAAASRRSLREPYSREVPNLWPRRRLRLPRPSLRAVARAVGRAAGRARKGIPRRRLRIAAGLLPLSLVATSCAGAAAPVGDARLPERLVPPKIGDFEIQREPSAEEAFAQVGSDSLVNEGRVYTVREGDDVLATFQAGAFKSDARSNESAIRAGITRNIGTGSFEVTRFGAEPVNVLRLPKRRVLLWFARDGDFYQLLEALEGFEEADSVFAAILAFQRGEDIRGLPKANPRLDPRLGGD